MTESSADPFAENRTLREQVVQLRAAVAEYDEQQKATAEILRAISSSPTDVQPVFDAVAESAARLCGAHDVVIRLVEGNVHRAVAHHGPIPAAVPRAITRGTIAGRAILDARTIHVPDVAEAHVRDEFPENLALASGLRTALAVPLVREGTAIGLMAIRRVEVRPFTEKQIKLLETFAAQAVIAIENVRLFNETKEALEQQTVISEILRVISSSPTDTQPVFDAIVKAGVPLFGGMEITLRLVKGNLSERVASTQPIYLIGGTDPTPLDDESHLAPPPALLGVGARAIRRLEVVQIPEIRTAEDWVGAAYKKRAEARGFRAIMGAPLIRNNVAIGAITVTRRTPGMFSDKQVALLKTFADQAVIAIENVRLFNETKEALEQQTATADILRVISSSPTDLQPVFDAILEKAIRLCDAHMGVLGLCDGERYQSVAQRGGNAEYAKFVSERGPFRPLPGDGLGRMIAERRPSHVSDRRDSTEYRDGYPGVVALVELGGARTYIAVPMLKEGRVVGGIQIYRPEVRPFTQKQIDLVSTFANQAVIAIENVRLFKELQARNADITEALEQQTATAEVLKVISRSTFDLETVLQTLMDNAAILCRAKRGVMFRRDGDVYRLAATYNVTPELREYLQSHSVAPDRATISGRSIMEKRPVHVHDVLADSEYQWGDAARLGNYRTVLGVPLLREGEPMGTIGLTRDAVEPFSEQEIALVTTFADQATIAIENVRLFNEIQDKSRQLEVASRHKSEFLASMSHELRTPLNAILGFNEMIIHGLYGEVPSDMKVPLDDIQSSGKHLLRLINNVLDLAKIEAGRMDLALADYSIHDTAESVRSALRPLAAEKKIEFIISVPEDIPLVHGDSGRIMQCLINLAGNSLKFTKAGKVEISVSHHDGLLTCCVSDTGVGIPPDKIGDLFTEFKQTDATIASEYGGTGLGLSITKKFIEMHGGRIWVESEVGQGSRFIFEIPLRAVAQTTERAHA